MADDKYLTLEEVSALLGPKESAKFIEELPEGRIYTNLVPEEELTSEEAREKSLIYLGGIEKLS